MELRLCWIVAAALCMAPLTSCQNCANFTTERPQDTVVAEGSYACLFCDYPDRNTEQWEKDTTSIRPGEPTDLCDCVASSGVQPVTLCFNSVSHEDIGDYTCVQQVNFGVALRCTVTLSLADAPQITNRPSDPNITLAIGATRTISVTYSQGNPPASVEWRKDGVLITGPTVSTSSSETMLTLTNSGPDVRGRYNVTVFNVGGSDTFVYNVKAEFAPVVNLTHSSTSNGFRLTCSAIAYPRVDSVRWEAVDSGNAISGSNDIFCQTESTTFDFCLTSTLDIESSSCIQDGYRCTVTNVPRTSSQSVSVCPTAPPPPPNSITVTVLNSTAVTVTWPVITTPIVDSYIIEYRVVETGSWNEVSSPRPPLIIPNLMEGVQYEFRGASQNSFGMSQSYSNIQLAAPCSAGLPSAVTGVDASLFIRSSRRMILIQWQQSQDPGVSGYRIYISPYSSSPININRVDNTSYEFLPPSCSDGTTYTIIVQAVNSCGSGGPNSTVQRECFAPNRIRIREILPHGFGITVSWESDQLALLSTPLILEIRDVPSLPDRQPVIRIYQIDELTPPTVCVGELIPRTSYSVCLNASYSDRPSSVDVTCSFTTTVVQDPSHIDTERCLRPNEIRGPEVQESTPISVPDWAIAVIVVGVLAIIALVFCFLGLCFACHTSNHKGGADFGSTSSIQTNSIRDGPIHHLQNHRQMSPSRSCLSYHAKGHSTNWNDHVDTLRQMDTGGTAV